KALVIVEHVLIYHLAQGGASFTAHYPPKQCANNGAGQSANQATGWATDEADLSANTGTLQGGGNTGADTGSGTQGAPHALGVVAGENMIRTTDGTTCHRNYLV